MGKAGFLAWIWLIYGGLWAQDEVDNPAILKEMKSFKFSLVRIPVWVHQKGGKPRLDLDHRDFNLLVNGQRVHIESFVRAYARPLELVYLLDLSGSMQVGKKLEGSIQAIDSLLQNHRAEDRWQVIVFSDKQVLRILDHKHADKWQSLKQRLRAYGKTALFDALSTSDRFFDAESLENRAILLFTDGNDNQSILTSDQLLQILKTLEVPVFIVGIADGFLPSKNKSREKLGLQTLEEITKISGGRLFIAKDRSELPQIGKMLDQSLRPQYLRTMTVERGVHDRRQAIDIRVKRRSSFQIRHRTGYIGSEPEFIGGN